MLNNFLWCPEMGSDPAYFLDTCHFQLAGCFTRPPRSLSFLRMAHVELGVRRALRVPGSHCGELGQGFLLDEHFVEFLPCSSASPAFGLAQPSEAMFPEGANWASPKGIITPAIKGVKQGKCSNGRISTHGCGSKIRYQNGTLSNGNMDQILRNPSCLILSHTHLSFWLALSPHPPPKPHRAWGLLPP